MSYSTNIIKVYTKSGKEISYSFSGLSSDDGEGFWEDHLYISDAIKEGLRNATDVATFIKFMKEIFEPYEDEEEEEQKRAIRKIKRECKKITDIKKISAIVSNILTDDYMTLDALNDNKLVELAKEYSEDKDNKKKEKNFLDYVNTSGKYAIPRSTEPYKAAAFIASEMAPSIECKEYSYELDYETGKEQEKSVYYLTADGIAL